MNVYILRECTYAHPPHIFFLDCPWSAAPTSCIVKGDRRWQETARFFLLEIAPFGTPKARLKNILRPKIVVQRATLSTVLDNDAVWRWQISFAPAERLTLPFRHFAASPFRLSNPLFLKPSLPRPTENAVLHSDPVHKYV